MKLKLHYANRLKEVPYAVQLIESMNGSEIEITFLNFGIEQGKEANTYSIQVAHPSKENTSVQFRGMLTNNNSFSIFLFKEIDNSLLPIVLEKQIKKVCTIDYIPRPDQTRDKEFISFTFELEELPVTKVVSKVERETQIKIWETYIRAIKALFRNQEDLFKILDINEPNKDIVDIKIEKEDWKKILISELGEQFPQFPLITDSKGKFEFAFDTEESADEVDLSVNNPQFDTKIVLDTIPETVKDNFFKITSKPQLVSRSFIKLNFLNREEKIKVASEILEELKSLDQSIDIQITENLSVNLKLEDISLLNSVISNKYSNLNISPMEAVFEYEIIQPKTDNESFCNSVIKQVSPTGSSYKVIPSDNFTTVTVLPDKGFLNKENFQFFQQNNLQLLKIQQSLTFQYGNNLPQIEGAVLNGRTYQYEGDLNFIRNKSEEIKKVSNQRFQTKSSYNFSIIFPKTDTHKLNREVTLDLYNTLGIKPLHNKPEITFSSNVDEYPVKLKLLQEILSKHNVLLRNPKTFSLYIKQKIEDENELKDLIERNIKKPLISEFLNNVKVFYNSERQLVEIEWSENYSNQQLLKSVQSIVGTENTKKFVRPDSKIEINQILTFQAELDSAKVDEFEKNRQRTFTGKGSAFLLDDEQAIEFEASRNLLLDEDYGTLIGNIDDWQRNRISISLLPPLLKAIKQDLPYIKNDTNLADIEEWIGSYIKPTLSGDLTQNRRLQYAIERVLYPTQPFKRSRKNKLTLFNQRLPEFIFDASQARPISQSEMDATEATLKTLNRLNPKQREAVVKALNAKDLFILQGPPGTGKTTVISEIIFQLLKRNPNTKILLTSQTHLAVDNALERLSGQSIVKPLRLGTNPDSFEEEGLKYFEGNIEQWVKAPANSKEEKASESNPVFMWVHNIVNASDKSNEVLQPILNKWREGLLNLSISDKELFKNKFKYNVVGATCSFTGHDKKFLEKLEVQKNGFDYVIFDEASKATPPELLIPLLAGRTLIVIGDHKQLPPMIEEDSFAEKLKEIGEEKLAEEIADAEVEKSQFEKLFRSAFESNKSIITTLDTQFRMHDDIMQLINQFYEEEGGLKCGLDNAKLDIKDFNERESRHHGIKLGNFLSHENHVLWINTTSLEQRSGNSYLNNGEISAIDKLLTLMKKSEGFQNILNHFTKEDEREIGLITFYGEQKKKLRDLEKKHHDLSLRVNTVDKFQGMERNIIIISTVRNNERGSIGFAEKLQRINVALSRAKRLLIIVGNLDHFAYNKLGVPYYKEIERILKNKGAIRDEKQLSELMNEAQ